MATRLSPIRHSRADHQAIATADRLETRRQALRSERMSRSDTTSLAERRATCDAGIARRHRPAVMLLRSQARILRAVIDCRGERRLSRLSPRLLLWVRRTAIVESTLVWNLARVVTINVGSVPAA